MFKTIKNAISTPEVRKKLLYTLLLIVIFRLGCYITIPGVDTFTLAEEMSSATNGVTTQSGDWSTYTDSGYTKLDMMFTALDGPFEEISEDWNVISRTATKIELKHISGGDGSIDYLTFEKD